MPASGALWPGVGMGDWKAGGSRSRTRLGNPVRRIPRVRDTTPSATNVLNRPTVELLEAPQGRTPNVSLLGHPRWFWSSDGHGNFRGKK